LQGTASKPIRDPSLRRQRPVVGGFGRTPGAIARLDDSLRALQILSLLDDPGL
jgi:hypothetical protein